MTKRIIKRSRKTLLFAGLIGMIVGAVALYTVHWSMQATSTTEFCVSCHSMEKPHLEWQGSVHYANDKGIQAPARIAIPA